MPKAKDKDANAPKYPLPECPKCHSDAYVVHSNKDIFACSNCNVTFKHPLE